MTSGTELGTITTDLPARLDRLPWARFHWLVLMVAGGIVEILLWVKAEQQALESIARPFTAEDPTGEARPAGATA